MNDQLKMFVKCLIKITKLNSYTPSRIWHPYVKKPYVFEAKQPPLKLPAPDVMYQILMARSEHIKTKGNDE